MWSEHFKNALTKKEHIEFNMFFFVLKKLNMFKFFLIDLKLL